MTEAEFRKSLSALATPGEAAYREFHRSAPEEWIERVQVYGPGILGRQRTLYSIAGFWALGLFFGTFLLCLIVFRWQFFAAGAAAVLGVNLSSPCVALLYRRPPSLAPLLVRLEDVTLVPLWLEVLPGIADGYRPAVQERLTRHLPGYWASTGLPLTDAAQEALRGEIRRLCGSESLSPDEAAFLTAALVSLDPDAARGATADSSTLDALSRLARQPDERVQAAAEDALQRLGHPPR